MAGPGRPLTWCADQHLHLLRSKLQLELRLDIAGILLPQVGSQLLGRLRWLLLSCNCRGCVHKRWHLLLLPIDLQAKAGKHVRTAGFQD
jgi:hypothetical protein